MKNFYCPGAFILIAVFVLRVSVPAYALERGSTGTFRSIDPYGSSVHEFSVGEKGVVLSRVFIESRNDIMKLRRITFKNLGTVAMGDVSNMYLYANSVKISGPVNSLSPVVINLSTPYSIKPLFPVTFELRGDIAGGAGKDIAFDPVVSSNIELLDENNADNVTLFKSELSQDIVVDRIALGGEAGESGETGAPESETFGYDSGLAGEAGDPESETFGYDSGLAGESGEAGEQVSNPFPDTDTGELEGEAAFDLYKRGVISGYPDGEFKGERRVNRVEALKILLEAKYDVVGDEDYDAVFSDVPRDEWYTKYVIKGRKLGIINGYSDGSFRPENTVNTAEFLKMLALVFGLRENLPYSYKDVSDSDWFARYAGAAQLYEMFPDRPHFLVPAFEMTRNDMVVAIYQYLRNSD